MITSEIMDRVIDFRASSTDVSDTPTDWNYFKFDKDDGYSFASDNTDGTYVPLQQGSGILTDDLHYYMYFIDSNANQVTGQTGHWVEITVE